MITFLYKNTVKTMYHHFYPHILCIVNSMAILEGDPPAKNNITVISDQRSNV